jgi:hypothetical protein
MLYQLPILYAERVKGEDLCPGFCLKIADWASLTILRKRLGSAVESARCSRFSCRACSCASSASARSGSVSGCVKRRWRFPCSPAGFTAPGSDTAPAGGTALGSRRDL